MTSREEAAAGTLDGLVPRRDVVYIAITGKRTRCRALGRGSRVSRIQWGRGADGGRKAGGAAKQAEPYRNHDPHIKVSAATRAEIDQLFETHCVSPEVKDRDPYTRTWTILNSGPELQLNSGRN